MGGIVEPAGNLWAVTQATTQVQASANLESGLCNQAFGESSAHACSRTSNSAKWVFDGSATATDNYRNSAQMTVYMKVDSQAWKVAGTHEFCMLNQPQFVVHWYVDDLAQDFGYKSASNPQVHRVQMKVTDNTRPRIHGIKYHKGSTSTTTYAAIASGSNGSVETTETVTLECGKDAAGADIDAYVEEGFEVNDNSDGHSCTATTPALKCSTDGEQPTLGGTCHISHNINQSPDQLDASYTVTYNYDDKARIADLFDHRDNCISSITTTVTIHTGGCNHVTTTGVAHCGGQASGNAITGDYLAKYTWAGTEGARGTKVAGTQVFPEYEAGTYAIQYKTTDVRHTVYGCRQIENVDHTHPIIQILGSDVMTLEATHQGNYIDDGATCSDQVDGVISQNVEVSGDVVNLSKVGTYTITYNCKDSANNAAPAAQRTVVVAQTSCPKCTMHGGNVVHEASFPYSDAGASCSDVIDGGVTTLCFAAHWEDQTGAKYGVAFDDTDVVNQYDGATTWTDKGYCDAATSGATTTCGTETTATNCVAASGCKWNTYHDCTSADNLVTVSQGTNTHSGAQIGTYYITYRAKSTVGLYNDGQNCRGGAIEYRRTVTVKDTLRPLITLKYNSVKVAQGAVGVGKDHAVDTTTDQFDSDARAYPSDNTYESQGNFPDDISSSEHDPALMAEENTSSVNGWVIGAIASAVAGLALLGYSTRRTAVATSVPV